MKAQHNHCVGEHNATTLQPCQLCKTVIRFNQTDQTEVYSCQTEGPDDMSAGFRELLPLTARWLTDRRLCFSQLANANIITQSHLCTDLDFTTPCPWTTGSSSTTPIRVCKHITCFVAVTWPRKALVSFVLAEVGVWSDSGNSSSVLKNEKRDEETCTNVSAKRRQKDTYSPCQRVACFEHVLSFQC